MKIASPQMPDGKRRCAECVGYDPVAMPDSHSGSDQPIASMWRYVIIICSMAALAAALIARYAGPSDLWDQTQPKTVSYTTDIVVHGGRHWILPIERGQYPATKPPLYNWMAVPGVKLMGYTSELAHKLPSVVALTLCWLLIVRLGRRIDCCTDQAVGWVAGLALVANYTIFKLGYLARPDMLLTLWLLVAWLAATTACIRTARRQAAPAQEHPRTIGPACVFWAAITLAALTKGPAAIVGIVYAVIAARVIGGSWRAFGALHPLVGFPCSAIIVGAWVYGVWLIDPQHLREQLWFNEIYGRVTGLGPEGNRHGPIGWLTDLPNHGMYYLVRFIPWSLCSIAAMVALWRKRDGVHGWRMIQGEAGAWLCGAAIFVVVVVGFFSLSAGKRADYISDAYPQGALLAAWWLLRMRPRLAMRVPWFVPAAGAIAMAALIIVNQRELAAPTPGFGDAILDFAQRASARIEQSRHRRAPIVYCWAGQLHVQALMGTSTKEGAGQLRKLIRRGRPFWVIAGRKPNPPHDFRRWVAQAYPRKVRVKPMTHSAMLPRTEKWPQRVSLYRVVPKKKPRQNANADAN